MNPQVVMWAIGIAISILCGVIAWDVLALKEIAKLLHSTRESYMTKSDCVELLTKALSQVDRDKLPIFDSLNRIEKLIVRNEERSSQTRHDMRDKQNAQGLVLERIGVQMEHQREATEKVGNKVDTLQVDAIATATAAATRVLMSKTHS